MHKGNQLRTPALFKSFSHLLGSEDVSPLSFDHHRFRPTALNNVLHPSTEHTVDANDRFISGFEQVDEARFHASTACTRNGKC